MISRFRRRSSSEFRGEPEGLVPALFSLRADDGTSAQIELDVDGGVRCSIDGWPEAITVTLTREDDRGPAKAWFEDGERAFSLALTATPPRPVGSMCVIDGTVIRVYRADLRTEWSTTTSSSDIDVAIASLARALRRNDAAWIQGLRSVRAGEDHPWASIARERRELAREVEARLTDPATEPPPSPGVMIGLRHALANTRRPRSIVRHSLRAADDELELALSVAIAAGAGRRLGRTVDALRASLTGANERLDGGQG